MRQFAKHNGWQAAAEQAEGTLCRRCRRYTLVALAAHDGSWVARCVRCGASHPLALAVPPQVAMAGGARA